MAQALDEAKHQRDLTKEFSRNLGLLETRVKEELDWKSRLSKDGTRYAVYAAATLAGIAGLVVLRRAVSRGDKGESDFISSGDIATELTALRAAVAALEKNRRKEDAPLWQKLLIRGVTAAAAGAATSALKNAMQGNPDEAERFPRH